MPELPDVENFRRSLERQAQARRIEQIQVSDKRVLEHVAPRDLARAVEHKQLGPTRRHGKHLFVALGPGRTSQAPEAEPGEWLHVHFGMTGYLAYFADTGEDPKHDRVRFDLAGGDHIAFVDPRRFGRIGLVEAPEAYIASESLGPDALAPEFDETALRAVLAGKRTLKAALTDQSAVAGIGNIYADEILFQAKLDPRRPPDGLDRRGVSRLFRHTKRVLQQAIAHGAGSDALFERIRGKTRLLPHRRENAPCPRCNGTIRAYSSGGRRGYFCPDCQK